MEHDILSPTQFYLRLENLTNIIQVQSAVTFFVSSFSLHQEPWKSDVFYSFLIIFTINLCTVFQILDNSLENLQDQSWIM